MIRFQVPQEPPATEIDLDQLAEEESARISSGRDLESEANVAQHGRRERARDQIVRILCWGINLGFLLIVLAAITYCIHTFGPPSWRFLTPEETHMLKNDLSHIILGVFVGFIIKNKFI